MSIGRNLCFLAPASRSTLGSELVAFRCAGGVSSRADVIGYSSTLGVSAVDVATSVRLSRHISRTWQLSSVYWRLNPYTGLLFNFGSLRVASAGNSQALQRWGL